MSIFRFVEIPALVGAATLFLAGSAPTPHAVGFADAFISGPNPKRLEVAIWYPSVSRSGPVAGDHLPLVVMSHGVRGDSMSHADTALALARAGFVAVAVTHNGDSWKDPGLIGYRKDLIGRPAQVARAIDYVLNEWRWRRRVDPARIGAFGHSLGGFTALVLAGGTPELNRIPEFCARRLRAPECTFIKRSGGDQLSPAAGPSPTWTHDRRVRAVVITAPALGFTFAPRGLLPVTIPIQLWTAKRDGASPNQWNSEIVAAHLPTRPELHTVDAGHFVFHAPCDARLQKALPALCSDPVGFNRSTFHASLNAAIVEFFVRSLPAPWRAGRERPSRAP